MHDANLLAARVADLAVHAAGESCGSTAEVNSRLREASAAAKAVGKGRDHGGGAAKGGLKGKRKSDALDAATDSADAENWSCVPTERNARRRVYDAVKVMVSAGCIHKQGKNLYWIGVDHLRRPLSHPPLRLSAVHLGVTVCFKRHSIARKMAFLAELQRRVRAFSQLQSRHDSVASSPGTTGRDARLSQTLSPQNPQTKLSLGNKRRTQAPPPRLDFPFLIVHAHDPDVTLSPDMTSVRLAAGRPINMFTETDVVCLLADRRSSSNKKLRRNPSLLDKPSDHVSTPVCTHSTKTQTKNETKPSRKPAPSECSKSIPDAKAPPSRRKKGVEKNHDKKVGHTKSCKVRKVNEKDKKRLTNEPMVDTVAVVANEPAPTQQEPFPKPPHVGCDSSEHEHGSQVAEEYDISQIVERGLELPPLGDEDLNVDVLCHLGPHDDSRDSSGNDILGWIKDHTGESFGLI